MIKRIILSMVFLIGLFLAVPAQSQKLDVPKDTVIPVVASFTEGTDVIVLIEIPFNHKGPANMTVANVSLYDRTAGLGTDYVLGKIGMAHNTETGDGLILLEMAIADDMKPEQKEDFLILVEFPNFRKMGLVEIYDNDGI